MALTSTEARLIRQSWLRIAPVASVFGDVFYGRLFAVAPELRPFFCADMALQSGKFLDMLASLVEAVERLDTIGPEIDTMAAQHVTYGVQPEHYGPVGEALIWTLDTCMSTPLSPAERAAWVRAYALVRDRMLGGPGYARQTG
ncbi:MAG: globin domain-containing protein [Pseudomonadota bacterium]